MIDGFRGGAAVASVAMTMNVFALVTPNVPGAETLPAIASKDGGMFSLVVENDIFDKTDRHYADGIR